MQSKHQAFQYTYGFICECESCLLLRGLGQAPERRQSPDAFAAASHALREFVGIDAILGPDLPILSIADLPITLNDVLHEAYLEQLSEEFSKAAHDGDYATAIISGYTLLALYLLIYPKNYPQTGEPLFSYGRP
jgi:SET and MYND domain-containing protein